MLLTRRLHAATAQAARVAASSTCGCRLGLEQPLVLLCRKLGVQGLRSGDIRVELRAHHSNLGYVWLQGGQTGSWVESGIHGSCMSSCPCSDLSLAPVSPADAAVAALWHQWHHRLDIERVQLILDLGGVVVVRVHRRSGRPAVSGGWGSAVSGGWAVVLQRHNAAASRKAAGWRDEGLTQRGRRRAGCRSVWKRHDDERHRQRHFREGGAHHHRSCEKQPADKVRTSRSVFERPQTAHLYFQPPESTPCWL